MPKIKPAQARSVWADFRHKLVDAKARIERINEMMERGRVRLIYVPRTVVRTHTRSAHWRPYYPPRLRNRPT